MAERKSILLYLDSVQQWQMLSDEQAGALIKALLRYGKTGECLETDDGMMKMAFSFMSAQIDRDGEKWERVCEKRSQAGKLGGRPKKQDEAKKANGFDEKQKKQMLFEKAKKADTETETETDTETDTETETDIIDIILTDNINTAVSAKPKHSPRFFPPNLEEVRAYCIERKNNIDAQAFIDFYESKGWMIGKQKMKDWRAAVRNWENRRKSEMPKQAEQHQSSIPKSELDLLFGGV